MQIVSKFEVWVKNKMALILWHQEYRKFLRLHRVLQYLKYIKYTLILKYISGPLNLFLTPSRKQLC